MAQPERPRVMAMANGAAHRKKCAHLRLFTLCLVADREQVSLPPNLSLSYAERLTRIIFIKT